MALNDRHHISDHIVGLRPAIGFEEFPHFHGEFFTFDIAAPGVKVRPASRVKRLLALGGVMFHECLRHAVEFLGVFLGIAAVFATIDRPKHIRNCTFLAMGVLAVKTDDSISQKDGGTCWTVAVFPMPGTFFQNPANSILISRRPTELQPLGRHHRFHIGGGVSAGLCGPGFLGRDSWCCANGGCRKTSDLSQQFDRYDYQ